MLHKTLEAKTTATDRGVFTALAATYSVDRMNERIIKGAFSDTILAWRDSGKQIPLHWDHSGAAEDIIGTVDPASMRETDAGLEVKGQLDLEESAVAKEAWRLMKKNAVALSFGYLVRQDAKGADGVRELKDLDLFEITITPAPANPGTKFLDLKSAWADPDAVALSPEAVIAGDELKGAQSGELKALWTSAYIAELPDEAFLYQGDEPSVGLWRRFHYRDAAGEVDIPHLKNALDCIPHCALPTDVKETLTAEAQQILDDATKAIEDASGEEPDGAKPEAQDPLSKGHDRLAFELATAGIDMAQPPPEVKEEPPEQPSLAELRRQSYDLMLETLIGSEQA